MNKCNPVWKRESNACKSWWFSNTRLCIPSTRHFLDHATSDSLAGVCIVKNSRMPQT
jgi:hypothetical protein